MPKVSSALSVAKIFPRTRKSGCPPCAASVASGSPSANSRNSWAVISLARRFSTHRPFEVRLELIHLSRRRDLEFDCHLVLFALGVGQPEPRPRSIRIAHENKPFLIRQDADRVLDDVAFVVEVRSLIRFPTRLAIDDHQILVLRGRTALGGG